MDLDYEKHKFESKIETIKIEVQKKCLKELEDEKEEWAKLFNIERNEYKDIIDNNMA